MGHPAVPVLDHVVKAGNQPGDAIVPDYWDCFTADYAAARNSFIDAATHAGAELTTYVHPSAIGPDGGALSIDVAHIGSPSAKYQLLALSGTHGLEGPAGSAIQIAWLNSSAARNLPTGVSVLLVHALNPYGFAHATRTTENNVDLNRNFVAHGGEYPRNDLYDELHAHLIPDEWNGRSLAAAAEATQRFRETHGEDALFDTLARGQYTHSEGLMFGGVAREWSNLTLETIVERHLQHASHVGLIDWHTGIGDYAEPFFLCFNEEGGAAHAEATTWWGDERISGQRPHGLARPNYQGLVFRGIEQFLGDRTLIGAVVEFGTRGRGTAIASRLDQWLRFKAPHALESDRARNQALRADVIDAMVPTSSIWRQAVIRHGLEITAQAIEGLHHLQVRDTRNASSV
ncbi:M14 family metallopeptidase [Paraburkholderia xenovorans]|uniref:M14 family metallopeptidase n=1 Tax=Paraburkholderia xenovorans TaxID=36873 RepID=UPI0038BC78F4